MSAFAMFLASFLALAFDKERAEGNLHHLRITCPGDTSCAET
jgi:hypothetical protein